MNYDDSHTQILGLQKHQQCNNPERNNQKRKEIKNKQITTDKNKILKMRLTFIHSVIENLYKINCDISLDYLIHKFLFLVISQHFYLLFWS